MAPQFPEQSPDAPLRPPSVPRVGSHVEVVLLVLQGASALQFGCRTEGTEPSEVGERSGRGDPGLEIVRVDPYVALPHATPLQHCRSR